MNKLANFFISKLEETTNKKGMLFRYKILIGVLTLCLIPAVIYITAVIFALFLTAVIIFTPILIALSLFKKIKGKENERN